MNPQDRDRHELTSLLGALREQTITDEEAARLRTRLREDKTARRELVEYMMLVAALREADIPLEQTAGGEATVRPFSGRRWRWPLTWAAAVALLATVTSLVWWSDQQRPVGVLARQEACVWSSQQRPLVEGELLHRGSLRLESGLAELRLGQGATLLLEGPAHLDLRDKNHCFLHFGRAMVRAEKAARGFKLDGPDGRIVDLGTEFGVCVHQAGGMEVHVLDGRVTAQPLGTAQPIELNRSEALQWSADDIQRLNAQPLAFVTDLPARTNRPIHYVHWSFDEGKGEVSRNLGRGLGSRNADARLTRALPDHPLPEWISGQFGEGLRFNAMTDFVECNFAGISGGNPRTVAFWVKVPSDITPNESYGIVSWGTYLPGSAWQISVNAHPEDGPFGRLRAGILTGAVVGTTDLRDDRWHHVAVVMYGGRRPDISTHVLLYIDGQLERTITKAVCEIHTDTSHETARRVRLGRAIQEFSPPDTNRAFFRGCLDEVFIFDAALTHAQIKSLLWHNRLPDDCRADLSGTNRPTERAVAAEGPQ